MYHVMARIGASSFCINIVEVEGHRTPKAKDENHQESAFTLICKKVQNISISGNCMDL